MAAPESIEVWGTGTPRTLRVYWALEELALPYTSHPVRTRTEDMDAADFLAISPGKKIPAIRHGALLLRESAAIANYLFDLAGRVPTDINVRAEIGQWESFALMELDATALYVLRRHRGLPEIYGEADAAIEAAEAYFLRQIAQVGAALEDSREFIAGAAISTADIALATCCAWARYEKLELPRAVAAYADRLLARPACTRARTVNNPGSGTAIA